MAALSDESLLVVGLVGFSSVASSPAMNLVRRPSNQDPRFSKFGLPPFFVATAVTAIPAIRPDKVSACLVTATMAGLGDLKDLLCAKTASQ
jgi:hypothetical protein